MEPDLLTAPSAHSRHSPPYGDDKPSHLELASSSGSSFSASSHCVEEEESHLPRSTRIVDHVKHHFGEIRNVWSKKVEELKDAIFALKVSSGCMYQRIERDREILDIVFCLFSGPSQQASNAIHLLEEAYLVYPDETEFCIPQLAVYLLYGPSESAEMLLPVLLRICSKSASFSHRLHYFISSFALSAAGVDSAGVDTMNRLLLNIARKGEISSLSLGRGLSKCAEIFGGTSRPEQSADSCNYSLEKVIVSAERDENIRYRAVTRVSDSSESPFLDQSLKSKLMDKCEGSQSILSGGAKSRVRSAETEMPLLEYSMMNSAEESVHFIGFALRNDDQKAVPKTVNSLDKEHLKATDDDIEVGKDSPQEQQEDCATLNPHFSSTILFWEKMCQISRFLGSVKR
jgi:hypothetical protein